MNEVKVIQKKYEFREWALRKWMDKGGLAIRETGGRTCTFYDITDPTLNVASVDISTVYYEKVGDFNNIVILDKEWLWKIEELLEEWKEYYDYPGDFVIEVHEYKEV